MQVAVAGATGYSSAMQWPDEFELELTSIAQGGDAVGRLDGRAVFASGGLPGELVRVRLYDRQASFARGRVTAVLRAAPERCASACPLEQRCGAADWRWIDHTAQRRFKADILREQLQHLGGLEIDVLPDQSPASSDDSPLMPGGYRTTAELHVAGTQIGYYMPGSRRVADVPNCCLHHPLINGALQSLRPLLSKVSLRGVTVRCSPSTGQAIAVLDGRGPLRELAQQWRRAYPALVGVTHAQTRRALDGQDWIERQGDGARFHVSASSFFQINHQQIERLVARVRALLEPQPTTRLLDVYCGVGLFALALAREVDSVVGVEEWEPAVADARRSARLNGIGNVTFHAGGAERLLRTLDGSFDRVVLDPPRRGCAPEAIDALARLRPARLVYVSCHPGTLARDCKLLATAGYRITSAEVIDMFPHTHHVESIVRLERDAATS